MASLFGKHKNVGTSKPLFNKHSKSPLVDKKMKIGSGKMKSPRMPKMGGISPSVDEFEHMMSSESVKPKKKGLFKKKL